LKVVTGRVRKKAFELCVGFSAEGPAEGEALEGRILEQPLAGGAE
jgi:hypothetical protein